METKLLETMVRTAEWMRIHGIRRVWIYIRGDCLDWTTVPDDAGPARVAFDGWS